MPEAPIGIGDVRATEPEPAVDVRLDAASFGLQRRAPALSAHFLLTERQIAIACTLAAAIIIFAATSPSLAIMAFNLAASTFFLAAIAFRAGLALVGLSSGKKAGPPPAAADILPSVTVLLPVRDEAGELPSLADAMARLDYPAEKLDIKLLLEEGDQATIAEAFRLNLDRRFECVIVPNGGPKTKPKALNYGLAGARGELVVIYDAEDSPEADQLRKAAAAFAHAGADLACLQARLNFYNADENFLTRLFALEYALWFDLLLPGLQRLRMPIPLGGTSNIFRTDILRKVGGWDPFNVTEDADLGLRLARLGYSTAILDSTTFEEANCRLGNWIRQRTRWMKGYMQTFLVHMRDPGGFLRAAGWRGLAGVQLFVAGNFLGALATPVLWAGALLWPLAAGDADPPGMAAANLAILLAGNLLIMSLAAIAPARRGWTRLVPYALLAPVYWQLASISAWRAVLQLVSDPSRWEKTAHGLSAVSRERRADALRRLQ